MDDKEILRNALIEGNLSVIQDYLHEDIDYVFSVKFEVIFLFIYF